MGKGIAYALIHLCTYEPPAPLQLVLTFDNKGDTLVSNGDIKAEDEHG
jgi:hypothetical protein